MNCSPEKPFMNLTDTCKATGKSVYSLRKGIKAGTVPFIRSGVKYLVNVPLLLEQMDAESRRNGNAS